VSLITCVGWEISLGWLAEPPNEVDLQEYAKFGPVVFE